MWESHSNANDRNFVTPTFTGTRSICTGTQSVKPVVPVTVVSTTPPVVLTELETLACKLFLSMPAPAPPPPPGTRGNGDDIETTAIHVPVPESTPQPAITVREMGPRCCVSQRLNSSSSHKD